MIESRSDLIRASLNRLYRVVDKHVLIVSPPDSYRIVPYIRAAQSLGLNVLLASHGEWAMSSPDTTGIDTPLEDFDSALALLSTECIDRQVDAVIGTDDGTLRLAAELARRLDLVQNPPSSVSLARRKDLSRHALLAAGMPVPRFRVVHVGHAREASLAQTDYPCVVKPLALAGSRGVIRADDRDQLVAAIERTSRIIAAEADLHEASHVLIEDFIPGREYALEGMLRDGQLELLALFDKPEPMDGPFFEETYYIMPSLLARDEQQRLIDTVQRACQAFGLSSGPVHAECRINAQGIWLIELAARTIGGLCSRLLNFGTGYTLEQLVLANACGMSLPVRASDRAAGVLMLPIRQSGILRRVEGVLAASRVPHIDDIQITIREGSRLLALPEGSSYLGFVFASADDPRTVETALRQANDLLDIVIAPFWQVEGVPR